MTWVIIGIGFVVIILAVVVLLLHNKINAVMDITIDEMAKVVERVREPHVICRTCGTLRHELNMIDIDEYDPMRDTYVCKTCILNSKYDRRAKTKSERVKNDRRQG